MLVSPPLTWALTILQSWESLATMDSLGEGTGERQQRPKTEVVGTPAMPVIRAAPGFAVISAFKLPICA